MADENTLCEVEAVFTGSVVEVEVVIGGTIATPITEHDLLTEDSRNKADQHTISAITGLQEDLNGKANLSHAHAISDVSALQSALDWKSNVGHGHSISDVSGVSSTAQTFTGEIDLSKYFTSYNNYTLTGALELTVVSGAIVGGFAQGIIIGNGSNTPTLSGITLDPNSADFNPANGIKNRFMVVKLQDAVYITYTEVV